MYQLGGGQAVEDRQVYVDDCDVGAGLKSGSHDQVARGDLGDYLNVWLAAQQRRQRATYDIYILG